MRHGDQLRAASARLRSARCERERHLPSQLASGPGWDLLLELHGEGERPSPSAGLNGETRKRWLKVLAEHGLVDVAPTDGSTASLSEAGRVTIERYLTACLAAGWV